ITAAQLVVGTVTTASSMTVPAGSVIRQAPAAGSDVVVGSAIALTVSSGLPHVSAPDVVGLTQSAATTAITGAQLVVGTVTTASSMTVPAGSVISQSPVAGSDVVVGTAIALTVSSGLPHVSAPNVVGLTQSAATTAITGAQLVVGTATTDARLTVPAGRGDGGHSRRAARGRNSDDGRKPDGAGGQRDQSNARRRQRCRRGQRDC